ncbi:hypothetical protein [Alkalihalobacillus sp. LMS39]|uniref:hypothetical protein n=1 Tax=Alkalihalobacillus sp. LMS39 TaxID=2924032 RepID=UPI001FB48FE4|nr:hypothetical protein [Alkalihalobacillus sp. LMS39]UOE96038.1 hypothetical protein MM271_10755 [Alkalihalobacillus sp. LMS39]
MKKQSLLFSILALCLIVAALFIIDDQAKFYNYSDIDIEAVLDENKKLKETISSLEYKQKTVSVETKSISVAFNTIKKFLDSNDYSEGKEYLIEESEYNNNTLYFNDSLISWTWDNSLVEFLDFSYLEDDIIIITVSFKSTFNDNNSYKDNWIFELTKSDDWKISDITLQN